MSEEQEKPPTPGTEAEVRDQLADGLSRELLSRKPSFQSESTIQEIAVTTPMDEPKYNLDGTEFPGEDAANAQGDKSFSQSGLDNPETVQDITEQEQKDRIADEQSQVLMSLELPGDEQSLELMNEQYENNNQQNTYNSGELQSNSLLHLQHTDFTITDHGSQEVTDHTGSVSAFICPPSTLDSDRNTLSTVRVGGGGGSTIQGDTRSLINTMDTLEEEPAEQAGVLPEESLVQPEPTIELEQETIELDQQADVEDGGDALGRTVQFADGNEDNQEEEYDDDFDNEQNEEQQPEGARTASQESSSKPPTLDHMISSQRESMKSQESQITEGSAYLAIDSRELNNQSREYPNSALLPHTIPTGPVSPTSVLRQSMKKDPFPRYSPKHVHANKVLKWTEGPEQYVQKILDVQPISYSPRSAYNVNNMRRSGSSSRMKSQSSLLPVNQARNEAGKTVSTADTTTVYLLLVKWITQPLSENWRFRQSFDHFQEKGVIRNINNVYDEELLFYNVLTGECRRLHPEHEFLQLIADMATVPINVKSITFAKKKLNDYTRGLYREYSGPCFDSLGAYWSHSSGETFSRVDPKIMLQQPYNRALKCLKLLCSRCGVNPDVLLEDAEKPEPRKNFYKIEEAYQAQRKKMHFKKSHTARKELREEMGLATPEEIVHTKQLPPPLVAPAEKLKPKERNKHTMSFFHGAETYLEVYSGTNAFMRDHLEFVTAKTKEQGKSQLQAIETIKSAKSCAGMFSTDKKTAGGFLGPPAPGKKYLPYDPNTVYLGESGVQKAKTGKKGGNGGGKKARTSTGGGGMNGGEPKQSPTAVNGTGAANGSSKEQATTAAQTTGKQEVEKKSFAEGTLEQHKFIESEFSTENNNFPVAIPTNLPPRPSGVENAPKSDSLGLGDIAPDGTVVAGLDQAALAENDYIMSEDFKPKHENSYLGVIEPPGHKPPSWKYELLPNERLPLDLSPATRKRFEENKAEFEKWLEENAVKDPFADEEKKGEPTGRSAVKVAKQIKSKAEEEPAPKAETTDEIPVPAALSTSNEDHLPAEEVEEPAGAISSSAASSAEESWTEQMQSELIVKDVIRDSAEEVFGLSVERTKPTDTEKELTKPKKARIGGVIEEEEEVVEEEVEGDENFKPDLSAEVAEEVVDKATENAIVEEAALLAPPEDEPVEAAEPPAPATAPESGAPTVPPIPIASAFPPARENSDEAANPKIDIFSMPIDFSPARENSEEAANPIASAFPPPRENSEEAGANPSANTSPEPEAAQPAADAPPEPKVIINKRKKKMSKEEKFQQMKDDTKKTEVIALIESERKRCAAEGLSMHPEVAKLMLEVIGDPLEVPEAMRVQEAFDIGKKQISLELLKEPSTSSHGPTVTSSSTQLSSSIASFYLQQKVKVKTHVKLGYDLGALGEEYHKNMEVFIQKQKLMKRENAKKLLTQDYKNKEKGISDKTGKIISIHHPSTLASEQEKVAEKHSETIKNREKIRDAQMFVSRKYLPAVYERVVIEKVMETSGGAVPGLFPGKNDNLTNKYGSPFLQMDTLPEPNNNQKSSNKNKTRKQTNHSGPSSTTASGVTTAAQTTTAGYYMASSAATTAQDGQEFRESDTWKNTRRSIDIYGVNPEFLRSGNMASEFNAVASYYDDIAEAREQQVLFMSQTALAQQQQLGGNNTSTQSQQQQKEMMAQTYHAGTGPFYQPQNNGNSNNSGNKLYHHRPRAETQNTKLAKISEKPPATLDEMEADVRGDFEQSRPKRRSDSRSVPPPASNPGADGSGAPGPAETNVKMGTPQNTVEDFDIPQYNYPLPDVVSSAEQTYKTSSENEDLLLNEQSKNTAGSLGTDEDRSLTASSRPKTKDSIIPPSVVAASPYGQIEVLNLDDMQEKKREKKRKKTAGGTTSGGNTNPSSKNNSLNNTKSSGFSTQSKESKKSSGQGSIADTSKEHSTTKPLASPYAGDQVEMLLSGSGSDVNSKKKTTTTSPKRKKTTDPAAKKKKQHQSTTSKESKMTDTSKLDSEEFPMPSGSDDKVVSGTEEESGSGTAPATTSETEQNQVKPAEQTEPLDEPIASDDEQYQNEEFEQEEVEETPMNNEGDHTFSKPTTAQTEFLERNVTSSGSTAIGSGGKLVSSSGKMKAGTSASKSSQGGQKKSSSTSKPPRTSSSHLSISTAGSSEGQKENQNQVEHFPFPTVAENEIFSPQDNVLGSESPLGAAVQNHVGMDTRTGKLELVENQDKLQQRLLPFGVSDDMTPGEKPAAVPPRSRGAVPSSRESSTTNAGRMTTPAASSGARNRPSTKSSSERKVPGSSGGANSRGKTPAASSSSRGNPGATTSSQSSQRPQHGGTRPSSTAKQPSPPASSQSTTREREQRRAGEQQPRTSAQQTTSTAQVAAPITTTTAQQGESATPEENYSDDEFEEDDQFILENNMPTIWAGDPQAASMFAPNDNVEQQSTRPNSSAAGSMVSFSRPGTQQSMFPPGNQPGTRPGTSSGNADNLFPFDEPATATQAGANNGMTTQGNNSTNSVGRPGTSEFQHRPGTSSSASISTQQVLSQSNFNNSQNQQVTFATEFATPDPFGNILIRPDSSSYGENDSLRDSKSSRKKRKSSRSSKSRGGDRDRENLSSAHHSREISGELFAGEFSESRPNTGSNSIRSHSRSSRQSNRPQLAEPNEFDFQGEFDPEEDTARKQRKRRNKDRSL